MDKLKLYNLQVGDLYEMDVESNPCLSRVPWFDSPTASVSADRPKDGTYVVYMGKGKVESYTHHKFLSSEGLMYYVFNTSFVHGLKRVEVNNEVL